MMSYSLQGFPSWEFAAIQYLSFSTDMQAIINHRHIPFTVEGMAPEQGWRLARAGNEVSWLNWRHSSSRMESLWLLHCHPQGSTGLSFPALRLIHTSWFYQYKVIQVSKISTFYTSSPAFHTHLLSTPTSPGARSHGQLSASVVRTMTSVISTSRGQNV